MNASHPALKAILRLADAEGATQRLAMEVIAHPRDQRERLIRHLRDQVAYIEARGGGTIGTA